MWSLQHPWNGHKTNILVNDQWASHEKMPVTVWGVWGTLPRNVTYTEAFVPSGSQGHWPAPLLPLSTQVLGIRQAALTGDKTGDYQGTLKMNSTYKSKQQQYTKMKMNQWTCPQQQKFKVRNQNLPSLTTRDGRSDLGYWIRFFFFLISRTWPV